MDNEGLVKLTVMVLPATEKAYKKIAVPKTLDFLIMNHLKQRILGKLRIGELSYIEEVSLLSELYRQLYGGPKNCYRVKDGYLWCLVKHRDGTWHWYTTGEGVPVMREPAGGVEDEN